MAAKARFLVNQEGSSLGDPSLHLTMGKLWLPACGRAGSTLPPISQKSLEVCSTNLWPFAKAQGLPAQPFCDAVNLD